MSEIQNTLGHEWAPPNPTIKWEYCRICLVIKRADGKNGVCRGPGRIRTFDEAFRDHRLKPSERRELVWFLAAYRYRKTIETLLPTPAHSDETGRGAP